MVKANIHSFESFGTVDGPGIRFVIFMQGCPLRCLYCHNPDTWKIDTADRTMDADELLKEVLKYKNFIKNGGVTCTGGEPLLQSEFLKEFFKMCRRESIHTVLDTSGCLLNDTVKEVLEYTSLVLLDVKSIDANQYKTLTGGELRRTLDFMDYLEYVGKPVWIRHVVVPGITDDDEKLEMLADYLKKYSVIEKVELLPYHKLGVHKYGELGIEYPLENIGQLTTERLENAKKIFLSKGFVLH